jgi:hypothetical protein
MLSPVDLNVTSVKCFVMFFMSWFVADITQSFALPECNLCDPYSVLFISFLQNVQIGASAYPASYSDGYQGFFLRGRADHSPSANAEVKNEWRCTSTSPACLRCSHRDGHTFNFTLNGLVSVHICTNREV